MRAGKLLSVWIGVWRSIYIESHQHNDGSHSVLKPELCKAESSSPNVQDESFSIARTSEFVRVIHPWRNRDRGWGTHKMLRHLHKLIGFCLCQHWLLTSSALAPYVLWAS